MLLAANSDISQAESLQRSGNSFKSSAALHNLKRETLRVNLAPSCYRSHFSAAQRTSARSRAQRKGARHEQLTAGTLAHRGALPSVTAHSPGFPRTLERRGGLLTLEGEELPRQWRAQELQGRHAALQRRCRALRCKGHALRREGLTRRGQSLALEVLHRNHGLK